MRRFLVVSVLVIFSLSFCVAQKKASPPAQKAAPAGANAMPAESVPGVPSAMNNIDPERIRETVKTLSDDKFEGRGTGQRGGDMAADYIAKQFKQVGLEPAGDNGTYFQKVPFVGITPQPDSTFTLQPKSGGPLNLKYADDYVAYNQTQTQTADVDAPIVFVGYGIQAPEYKWDDYKGVDVKGKVLLMLVNEPTSDDPKFFTGPALTYYGRWTYKYEQGARKGAVGVILIHETKMASYGWDVVRNSNTGEKSFLKLEGPALKVASWIQYDVAKKLLENSGQNIQQLMQAAQSRDFKPIDLGATLKAHLVSKVRPFESNNVLGILRGSDPQLKSQAIAYSAHYDHLGIRPDQPGDNIYNGADDNATGCGILLEMARAYASGPKPKRSVLFAAVTAEEQGLLGSEYLGKHPPIPAKDISLGLNFDDIKPWGVPEEVEITGANRMNFYPVVEKTAAAMHLAIKPDANPGAGHYYRSDHFSWARVGVPSFSINEGLKFVGHDLAWGRAKDEDYVQHHYHQPSDQYDPSMDFRGDAVMGRFGYALGWQAANAPAEVQWKAGDEFEAARKKSDSQAGK